MPNNVTVLWPGQPDPTRGVHDHRQESIEFFTIFPDNQLANNPYKILFQKMICKSNFSGDYFMVIGHVG